jgi:hypothetical protein
MCVERCANITKKFSRFSLIILMAAFSTNRMSYLRESLTNKYKINWLISLAGDWHPGKLFEGVRSQFVIITSANSLAPKNDITVYTTNYKRWFNKEREQIFDNIKYFLQNPNIKILNPIPRFGENVEESIWNKILIQKTSIASYKQKSGLNFYYRNAGLAYYMIAINFEQEFTINNQKQISSTLCDFYCRNQKERDTLVAIFNSNLFAWYFFCFSDCYHLTVQDLKIFRFQIKEETSSKIIKKTEELMLDINQNSTIKVTKYKTKGTVKYQEFYPRKSKPIIDEIDKVLAEHYGFSEEELDFIINYDIKYRMGKELDAN